MKRVIVLGLVGVALALQSPQHPPRIVTDSPVSPVPAEIKQAIEPLPDTTLQPKETVEVIMPAPQPAPLPPGNCVDWMVQAGITDIENASWIIGKESGCNPCSFNPGGSDCNYAGNSACGIPQALPCSKLRAVCQPWNDAVCQLRWMNNYVVSRYGSWAGAVSFWRVNNWY